LLARLLRDQALRLGVVELRDAVMDVESGPTGEIRALLLAGGARLEADFYFDCSGARGVLSTALGVAQEDWSAWLPCDRLQAVQLDGIDALPP